MKRFVRLAFDTAVRFNENDGWAHSSHIAMSMLLALFPFCIFSLSLAGVLSSELNAADLVDFIFGTWPDAVAEPIEREIAAVLVDSTTKSITLGALFAIFFASNGVDAIRMAIIGAYHQADPRPVWKARLVCVVFVICGGILLSLASLLTVVIPLYFDVVEQAAPSLYARFFATEPVRITATAVLLWFAMTACHLWLPGERRPLRRLLPGILLTIVLWILAAQGFAFYMRNIATYSVTYAGLAGVMAALVFMYLMAALFILGAELNGLLWRERESA